MPRNASLSSHGPRGCTFEFLVPPFFGFGWGHGGFGQILAARIRSTRTTPYICASGPRPCRGPFYVRLALPVAFLPPMTRHAEVLCAAPPFSTNDQRTA